MVAPGNEPPSLGLTPLSRVTLDELLQEMLDRVGEVVTSRERLRALLDAIVGIGTGLDLRSTLQRIVVSAGGLAGAEFGARASSARTASSRTSSPTASTRPRTRPSATSRTAAACSACASPTRSVRMPVITRHPRS